MTPSDLRAAAQRLPRVMLGHWPTPLEELPRFSNALGGDVRVWIKRDDCSGLLLGGNKTRHNEFVLGDCVSAGCDTVVWGAAVQSNNCRQTAAACAKLGLECRLYLSRAGHSVEPQGNLLLDYLVGARIEFTDATLGPELDDYLRGKADEARAEGRNPFWWDRPRVLPRATVSYAVAMAEIAEQCTARSIRPAGVTVASAGATGSGVVLGAHLLGMTIPIRLISPMHWPWSIPDAMAADAMAAAQLMKIKCKLASTDFAADESFVAPGYGLPSPASREAFDLLARTEGILTDPVYSAKALTALIADIRAGRYARGSNVIFLHTGGVPAIFAEPEKVLHP
jgi:1-aminocyclopropane-1-carboxylate deaminase/D-cysteine desulfhydrase-like pyridoxal-dependent ACC family enzyme